MYFFFLTAIHSLFQTDCCLFRIHVLWLAGRNYSPLDCSLCSSVLRGGKKKEKKATTNCDLEAVVHSEVQSTMWCPLSESNREPRNKINGNHRILMKYQCWKVTILCTVNGMLKKKKNKLCSHIEIKNMNSFSDNSNNFKNISAWFLLNLNI